MQTGKPAQAYSPQTVLAVWNLATAVAGHDPRDCRRDCHGNPIRFGDYGNAVAVRLGDRPYRAAGAGRQRRIDHKQALQWRSSLIKNEFWPWDLAS